ncbi:hypothetical protein LCY76_23755 [Fictibacillus sp. KIGAM418]|uniref:Uncharacterized protein n=1 Tax=Fictibacillus marinisediminis TaxID=2878389 RepID=A0A9X2BFB9_9BACL|nr:hypothetical protein [Fictibacillus marinisediminis]MCK6259586.1 hypothetical protein [Fictibacillus marinisediminis]
MELTFDILYQKVNSKISWRLRWKTIYVWFSIFIVIFDMLFLVFQSRIPYKTTYIFIGILAIQLGILLICRLAAIRTSKQMDSIINNYLRQQLALAVHLTPSRKEFYERTLATSNEIILLDLLYKYIEEIPEEL